MREHEIEAERAAVAARERVCAVEECPLPAQSMALWGENVALGVKVVVPVCWWHALSPAVCPDHPDVSTLRCLSCDGALRKLRDVVKDEEGRVYRIGNFYECVLCKEGWEVSLYHEELDKTLGAAYDAQVEALLQAEHEQQQRLAERRAELAALSAEVAAMQHCSHCGGELAERDYAHAHCLEARDAQQGQDPGGAGHQPGGGAAPSAP
jgi:uncharacterized protein with PIN domain